MGASANRHAAVVQETDRAFRVAACVSPARAAAFLSASFLSDQNMPGRGESRLICLLVGTSVGAVLPLQFHRPLAELRALLLLLLAACAVGFAGRQVLDDDDLALDGADL